VRRRGCACHRGQEADEIRLARERQDQRLPQAKSQGQADIAIRQKSKFKTTRPCPSSKDSAERCRLGASGRPLNKPRRRRQSIWRTGELHQPEAVSAAQRMQNSLVWRRSKHSRPRSKRRRTAACARDCRSSEFHSSTEIAHAADLSMPMFYSTPANTR